MSRDSFRFVVALLLCAGCSDSSIYTVYPQLAVHITSPAPGAEYWLGATVPLSGSVTLGGALEEGTTATWSVDETSWSLDAELDSDLTVSGEYTPERTGQLVVRLCLLHDRSPPNCSTRR